MKRKQKLPNLAEVVGSNARIADKLNKTKKNPCPICGDDSCPLTLADVMKSEKVPATKSE